MAMYWWHLLGRWTRWVVAFVMQIRFNKMLVGLWHVQRMWRRWTAMSLQLMIVLNLMWQ